MSHDPAENHIGDATEMIRLERENAKMRATLKDNNLAHELWAMAQLMPTEGIADAVDRIQARLASLANGTDQPRDQ